MGLLGRLDHAAREACLHPIRLLSSALCARSQYLRVRLEHLVALQGSESDPTSAENILFNTCYFRYITALTGNISKILGHDEAAVQYQAMANRLSAAVTKAFYNASTGLFLDALQTHQVMPLATGVADASQQPRLMTSLEHTIRVTDKGHLDTGLTGTYFMTKHLTETGRNDLVFLMANQTTFPSYGYRTGTLRWAGCMLCFMMISLHLMSCYRSQSVQALTLATLPGQRALVSLSAAKCEASGPSVLMGSSTMLSSLETLQRGS